jgi:integrase/recombinase XerD
MLERYFVMPRTVDRIRGSWIGSEIEQYVDWLAEREYAPRSVLHRVPVLVAFGEFAWAGGARTVAELPGHVEGFVAEWMTGRPVVRQGGRRIARQARVPDRADADGGHPRVRRQESDALPVSVR